MVDIHEVELVIPPTAVAATIRVKVTPSKGAVLIFGAPLYDKPIKFHGPQQIGRIATTSPIIRVQMVDGALAWEIETRGWEDNVSIIP
jgi:hypothetical protein